MNNCWGSWPQTLQSVAGCYYNLKSVLWQKIWFKNFEEDQHISSMSLIKSPHNRFMMGRRIMWRVTGLSRPADDCYGWTGERDRPEEPPSACPEHHSDRRVLWLFEELSCSAWNDDQRRQGMWLKSSNFQNFKLLVV